MAVVRLHLESKLALPHEAPQDFDAELAGHLTALAVFTVGAPETEEPIALEQELRELLEVLAILPGIADEGARSVTRR